MMDAKTRASANARFQQAQRPRDGRSSFSPQETEARAVDARTAKLKEQRLARDAAETTDGTAAKKRAAPVRKVGAKKGVGSY